MRLLFAGTPEVSVPSLRALLGSSHDVVAVQGAEPHGVDVGDRDAGPAQPVLQRLAHPGQHDGVALAAVEAPAQGRVATANAYSKLGLKPPKGAQPELL